MNEDNQRKIMNDRIRELETALSALLKEAQTFASFIKPYANSDALRQAEKVTEKLWF